MTGGNQKNGRESTEERPFEFAEEKPENNSDKDIKLWKVLVVDDEHDVHHVTEMVLKNIRYKSRPIKMLSSYSLIEAVALCSTEKDIALILLDVIMETPDAGLKFVEFIREQTGNKVVRIILRTGQPGQVPEREVVEKYDINDYKTKTELTSEKLTTTVISALRNYELLLELDDYINNLSDKINEKTIELEVLLNDTLKGSVKTLVDMLAITSPVAFSRTQRMLNMARQIGKDLNKEKKWELEMAVLLSQIGCIAVPDEIMKKALNGEKLVSPEKEIFESFPAIGSELVQNIPRLERVGKAIEKQLTYDPDKDSAPDSDIEAFLYLLSEVSLKTPLEINLAETSLKYYDTAKKIGDNIKNNIINRPEDIKKSKATQKIAMNDIQTGSVLANDILSIDGDILVPRGQVVTDILKKRLKNRMLIKKDIKEPIDIAITDEAEPDVKIEIMKQLTSSEQNVYLLICRGYSNADIARELCLSQNTIKFHVKNILQKTGCASKLELLALKQVDIDKIKSL